MFKPVLKQIPRYRVANPPHEIKLNQNESPLELPPAVRRRILDRMAQADWNRYPPYPPDGIRKKLARRLKLSAEQILFGHGSNELVLSAALATLRRNSRVVIPHPSFVVFERVSRISEAKVTSVPLARDLSYDVNAIVQAAAHSDTKLVFLASPNNPTGTVLAPEEVEEIATATPGLVFLDEAYYEFTKRTHRPLIDRLDNLVISRTFSKAYAMASMRLGFVMGSESSIANLEAATLPFNIDQFAQVAAEELLDHSKLIRDGARTLCLERERLSRSLGKIKGVAVVPSQANFILVRTPPDRDVWKRLVDRGILVRDVSNSGPLANCLRITVGTVAENDAVIAALRDILA